MIQSLDCVCEFSIENIVYQFDLWKNYSELTKMEIPFSILQSINCTLNNSK